jgi:hypothetical protein
MSDEARARIAEAQRARWARQKGPNTAPTRPSLVTVSGSVRRGRRLSPAARARIAAAQKARWAKVRAHKKKAA